MPRYIGTCFRFYTQMRVQKKTKHLHIEFIVTSHNSVASIGFLPILTLQCASQIYGGDFAKLCGLLRIYELYTVEWILQRHNN